MNQLDFHSRFKGLVANSNAEYQPDVPEPGVGVPIFDESDASTTRDDLSRMLRLIYIKMRITDVFFDGMFKIYATKELGLLPGTDYNNAKGNLLKAIRKSTVSWMVFRRALCAVGLNPRNILVDVGGMFGTERFDLCELEGELGNYRLDER